MKHLFVFIQFAGLAYVFMTAPFFCHSPFLLTIEITGIIVGFWAIFTMRIDNLRIYPDIKENAKLVTAGPYKLIRHPMYLAIFLTILPLAIEYFSWIRIIVSIILFVDLIFKLNYEEALLKENFVDYKTYKIKTFRLFPFIY